MSCFLWSLNTGLTVLHVFQLEQLAESGEESIVITANIGEGTADHLGSNKGSSFLEARDELQRQFLSYCTG